MRSAFSGPDITMDELATFTLKDVVQVYSGRNGCMCGCKGQYRYTMDAALDGSAKEENGHDVDVKDVNDKQCKKVLETIQKMAQERPELIEFGSNNVAVSMPDRDRLYVVYVR